MLHSKINDYYHGQDTPQSLQELILFLSDISNRHIHGLRDNDIWKEGILTQDKSRQRLQNIKAGYGLLNCHCRYISQTANTLLKEIGIESRQVELLSGKHLEKDSRHIISEIIWQNSYFLYYRYKPKKVKQFLQKNYFYMTYIINKNIIYYKKT